MTRSKGLCRLLVCLVALLTVVGCSDDDVVDVPVDQAVEAGLNDAMASTVVPLVTFLGTVGDLLSAPLARSPGGFACPDTSAWCGSGSADCTVGANGLDFDFDECAVVGGDLPMTLDGNVTVVPGSVVGLTLTNLFINNHPAISGTGTIDVANCEYSVNCHNSDASVVGTVTQCDDDQYPTGETVVIGFDDFLVTIELNGLNPAAATATRDGTPVADCTLDLDTLTSSCDAL